MVEGQGADELRREVLCVRRAPTVPADQQRAALTEKRIENDRKEADSRAYALEATLKPVRDVDCAFRLARKDLLARTDTSSVRTIMMGSAPSSSRTTCDGSFPATTAQNWQSSPGTDYGAGVCPTTCR